MARNKYFMASNHVIRLFLDGRQIGRKGLYDNKLSFLYKFVETKISPKWHSIYRNNFSNVKTYV